MKNHSYRNLLDKTTYDQDEKSRLPVHLILGAGEYAKVKTKSAPKIDEAGEPVAELTKFGWIIMSPGKEPLDVTKISLMRTSHVDYEELCRLDVLGLTHPQMTRKTCTQNSKRNLHGMKRAGTRLVCPGERTTQCYRTTEREVCDDLQV